MSINSPLFGVRTPSPPHGIKRSRSSSPRIKQEAEGSASTQPPAQRIKREDSVEIKKASPSPQPEIKREGGFQDLPLPPNRSMTPRLEAKIRQTVQNLAYQFKPKELQNHPDVVQVHQELDNRFNFLSDVGLSRSFKNTVTDPRTLQRGEEAAQKHVDALNEAAKIVNQAVPDHPSRDKKKRWAENAKMRGAVVWKSF